MALNLPFFAKELFSLVPMELKTFVVVFILIKYEDKRNI